MRRRCEYGGCRELVDIGNRWLNSQLFSFNILQNNKNKGACNNDRIKIKN